MFSNYSKESILGKKSKCGCSTKSTSIHIPNSESKMDITLVPVNNPTGSQNYIPLINQKVKKSVSFHPNEIIESDFVSESPLEFKGDIFKTFYIGSITVIGLYIVYRIIEKSK